MNSYVDVNLDGSGANGTEQSGGGGPAQKYVTFDDDISPSYDQRDQPFSAPKVAPTVPDYSRQQQQQYPPRQQQQQQYPSQEQRISGLVSQNSNPCIAVESPKLETIRKWTVQHYKMTKQIVNEKMGNSTKTVDKELEDRIEDLRTSKVQYTVLLKEARSMFSRFESLLASHRNMRSNFQSLIAHVPALQDQLQANATTQSILEKNGEGLLGALRTFVDGLHTLVNVTMQDTFLTIKNYENSRIEYDAYRNEIDAAQSATQTDANRNKLLELQVIFESRKLKWEKLKSDTHIKLNLLQENKLMVMKQQLEMFNSAVIAYFSGNGEVLSEVLSEYHIKSKALSDEGDATTKSFLAKD